MPEGPSRKNHCETFLAANADREVHKAPHDFESPPALMPDETDSVIARRLTVSLVTAQSSFDVWAALARLDVLLSDYRRLAPRFAFEQLTGQPSIAAGNEYRFVVTDPAWLGRIEAACSDLSGERKGDALKGARTMDVRVSRAGPWGGETGEMVVEALNNHAMAGMASLWILIHGDDMDSPMRLRLDVFEVMRWAWEPDRLAARDDAPSIGILDWPYLFERLAEGIDASPVAAHDDVALTLSASLSTLSADARIGNALALHPALAPLFRTAG